MYTRGPVAEAESAWERVLELAAALDDNEYQLRALYGLWLYKILVCEYRAAVKLTKQFEHVAESAAAATEIPTADRMMSLPLHYLGDQTGARVRADRSLGGPVPTNRHRHITHYGVDQRVGALVQLARALWLQGLMDQAVQVAQASVDEAANLGHSNSMCLALADGASIIAIMVGNLGDAEHFAAMLDQHADKHALGVWRTYGHALRGRILMQKGAVSDGVTLLKSALADLRETPFDIRFQLYLVWLAEVQGAAGQVVEALAAIDEALKRAERREERWYLPELLRIRGELLLKSGATGSIAAARECFAQSLHWAQSQNALAWDLRTTMSVVRSRRDEGSATELRVMLESALARFSEGFGTGDLVAARSLLAELER
jgi:predicted ATPase